MLKPIKRLIALTIMTTTILGTSAIGINAEWKQNTDNTWSNTSVLDGWFKDGLNWYFFKNGIMQTGWIKDSNGKYYYLSSNGNMLTNTTTPDGYKVGSDGVWIQNTTTNSNNTTNTNTNVENTANSNNSSNTNLTNDVDVTVDNTSKEEKKYYKTQNDNLKVYNEKKLEESKQSLAEAQADLERIQNQKSVQTLKEVNGQWQYVYEADKSQIDKAKSRVSTYQNLVEYYEKLVN